MALCFPRWRRFANTVFYPTYAGYLIHDPKGISALFKNPIARLDTMKKSLVIVAIPIYKTQPNAYEAISLKQCLQVLRRYPITFITPRSLDIQWYQNFCRDYDNVTFEYFDNLGGHKAYSNLMLSNEFYGCFLNYDYLLIYHLDAFVFKDSLTEWCDKGYDYIGAYVFNPVFMEEIAGSATLRLYKHLNKKNYVGNGGFSLRKISSLHAHTKLLKPLINYMTNRREIFLEDLFWCMRTPQINPFFGIPTPEICQKFAVEFHPTYQKEMPFSRIDDPDFPFGCHGWIQFNIEFWKPFIQQQGHVFEAQVVQNT
jgi:Protein of unknown function (DUF5672)